MMKVLHRVLALILCVVLIVTPAVCAAQELVTDGPSDGAVPVATASDADAESEEATETEEPAETEKPAPELVLSDAQLNVTAGASVKIAAALKNGAGVISWSSGNTKIATVDNRGVVTGVSAGSAEITASAVCGENTVTASCTVNVTSKRVFPHLFLSVNYEYTKMGDYFYSDNNNAWQKPFGFIRLYDIASQLIGYEYDFTRVVFNYGKKDWLIEFWKGQYGIFQVGGEIGVYTKYATGFGDTVASVYNCAEKEDWLDMEMTLYHQQEDGSFIREFTREYGKYWWCDGYRIGRLRKSRPATELKMVSRITLKDEKMATAFAAGMKDCGFSPVSGVDSLKDDSYYRDGCDVYFIWRNLTESQNLVPLPGDVGISTLIQAFITAFQLMGEAFVKGIGNIGSVGLFNR